MEEFENYEDFGEKLQEFNCDFDENEDHENLIWFSATLIAYTAHRTRNKCSDIVRVVGDDFLWIVYKSAEFFMLFTGLVFASDSLINSYSICDGVETNDDQSHYAVGRSYTKLVVESECEPTMYWLKLYEYLLEDRVTMGGK